MGLLLLGSGVFVVSYLLFNKHPVHMMLIAKAYLRDSTMSPTPEDTMKLDGLKQVPSLAKAFKRLKK